MENELLAIVSVLLLLSAVVGAQPGKFTFLQEASSSASSNEEYDYIVVGGGTAGCPLAATLSEKFKVLLLERGGVPYGNPDIERIEMFVHNLVWTNATSPAQAFISEDGVINRRPRVLGGGTCLNAGFYTRASQEFIQKAGWDEKLVDESYSWVENVVAFAPELKQWQSAVRRGLLEVGILPDNGVTYDHLIGTKTGGSIFDSNGHRHTAADLLKYANPSSIKVMLHATTNKILFTDSSLTLRLSADSERPRAYGVVYTDTSGMEHRAVLNSNPRSEVILSAGALGSPQLLMLSGIGPEEHLKAFKIPVVMNAPNVGQGMADNPMNAIFVPSPKPLEVSLVEVVGITSFGSFIESASPALGITMISSVPPPLRTPSFIQAVQNQLQEMSSYLPRTGVLMEKVDGPVSSGYLKLRNTDPHDNPAVRFNYFSDPQDLNKCVQGIQLIERVIGSSSMTSFTYVNPEEIPEPMLKFVSLLGNLLPLDTSNRIAMETFCRATVTTIWHYHGGCQVGRVVDDSHRVIGVNNLRVIDGSTFLSSPGTNPQATVMMMGRQVYGCEYPQGTWIKLLISI
ncbi:hypothetical protein SELMODRAFT_429523 [Selaginella moellendorffii]|uniref:Glucose-methanol-choline oxidoreductase N-terminal domain-containing protein n=1 Tax=Selaginella moellendorffii TaxID=88036 RepID=D8T6G3_SELML|nr:hypothetical protein SELMODRAFT_429523 [Selaginella moellendorffii]